MINFTTNKKMLANLLFLFSTFVSCGDSEEVAILDIADYTVEITSVTDSRNNGGADDILIAFDAALAGSMVDEYRLFVIPSSSVNSVNLESAMNLEASRYTSVTDQKGSYFVFLSAMQVDFNGVVIELGSEYQAFVMSIGEFEEEAVYTLSAASEVFTIIQEVETSTLVSNFRGNDALSIDADGNIYVSNYGVYEGTGGNGNAAFKVSPSGQVSEFVSNLSGPLGNAIDTEGNFYVNNGNDNTSADLLKIAGDGTQTIIANIEGFPSGMLLGTDGNFYITNFSKPVVNKVTPEGIITDFASDSRLNGGVGIVYDDNGNILVGNFITGDILSISPDGSVTTIATIPTVVNGFVIGYITYFEGYIYATGYGSFLIYKVALSDGTITAFAGNGQSSSKDGVLNKASFITPNGIAVDKTRRILYISENGNGGGLRTIPLE